MKFPPEVLLKIFDNVNCLETAYNLWMDVIDTNEDPCLRQNNFISYLKSKRWERENGEGIRVFAMPHNKNVDVKIVEQLTARSMRYVLQQTENWNLQFFASRIYNLLNECQARMNLIVPAYENLHDHLRVLHRNEEFEKMPLIWKLEMRIRMKKALIYLNGLREFLDCDIFGNNQLESLLYQSGGLVYRETEEEYKEKFSEENDCAWWLD